MRRPYVLIGAAIGIMFCLQPRDAAAAPIQLPLNGSWVQFNWLGGPGPTFEPDNFSEEGYLITSTQPVAVRVTDAFQPGDAFDVFVNGLPAFSTPSVPTSMTIFVNNPGLAFVNAAFSSGENTLPMGTNLITVSLREGTLSGGGFIGATAAVPEPASVVLIGSGLLAGAAARQRRRKTSAGTSEKRHG